MTTLLIPGFDGTNAGQGAVLMCQALFLDVWDAKPAALERLQSMPANALVALLGRLLARGQIKIRVDRKGLDVALRQLEHHRVTRRQLREFICAGASYELVAKLFPVTLADYRLLRVALSLSGDAVMSQRSRQLRFDEQLAVWRKWRQIAQHFHAPGIEAVRDRYLALSAAFPAWSLATLERAMIEERNYAGADQDDPDDAPVVVVKSLAEEPDGLEFLGVLPLVEALLSGPRLEKVNDAAPVKPAPAKKAQRRPPAPSKAHPWRKLDQPPGVAPHC